MELLITVAIVAILGTLALPSLSSYLRESRRVDGIGKIQEMAGSLGRYYAENARYTANELSLGYGSNGDQPSDEGYYTVGVDLADATSYQITAKPVGGQANDSIKGFRLNAAGQKSYLDSANKWHSGWDD